MKIWTAHEKPRVSPVLVREGFSLGALLFGPFWLAAHRTWLPAAAAVFLYVAVPVLAAPPASLALTLGLAVILGFSGRDLVRWTMARDGYLETTVVSGRDEDEARHRLLTLRPDLTRQSMIEEAAP